MRNSPEQRVLLQFLDGGDRPQRHLGPPPVRRPRLVRHARELLLRPALQRRVHRLPARLQIRRDRLGVPALDVQPDDRQPPLDRVGDGVVGREAPVGAGRRGFSARTRLTVCGLGRWPQRAQQIASARGCRAAGARAWHRGSPGGPPAGASGASRPSAAARGRPARAGRSGRPGGRGCGGGAGLGGALGRRLPEEDDRADQLVGALPRRPRQEFDLAASRRSARPAVVAASPAPFVHARSRWHGYAADCLGPNAVRSVAPSPQMARPAETRSRVVFIFAKSAGPRDVPCPHRCRRHPRPEHAWRVRVSLAPSPTPPARRLGAPAAS